MASLPWRRHKKKDIPGDLWVRCPDCGATVFGKDLDDMLKVCPECGHHFPISSHTRIAYTLDPASWQEYDAGMEAVDALGFVDNKPYPDKLADEATRTGLKEAMRYGLGTIEGRPVVFGVLEFKFMGGSMGVVVGEKVTRAVELAHRRNEPLILVAASGGARMHEGILSLMQMAKVSAALARYDEAGGLFISVLTNPTMGGVAASFASLGDLVFAEPKALIGFAGPRTIKATLRTELPEGFQTSEFLLEHGYIDRIVCRSDLKSEIARAVDYCGK